MLISDEAIRALRNMARVRLEDAAARSKTIIFRCDEAIAMLDEIARLRAENDQLCAALASRGPWVCSGCGVAESEHETYCGEPSYERQVSEDGSTSPDRCGEWVTCGEHEARAALAAKTLRPETVEMMRAILADIGDWDAAIAVLRDLNRCYPPEEE